MERSAEYIYEIYRHGSFSKAARELFVSQPALSAVVKKKENELGFLIFNRNAHPLELTEEGEIYIRMLENIRESEEAMRRQIRGMRNAKNGKLLIGTCNYASAFVIPAICHAFSEKNPTVRMDVCEDDAPLLREKMRMGLLDLMADYDPDPEDSVAVPILREHLLLAVPADYAVNDRLRAAAVSEEQVCAGSCDYEAGLRDLSAFAHTRFVLCGKRYNMFRRMNSLCRELDFSPEVANSTNQLLMNFNMACQGAGVTLTTDTMIRTAPRGHRPCVFYPVRSEAGGERTLYVAYKKRDRVPEMILSFASAAADLF